MTDVIYYRSYASPLGAITLLARREGLTHVMFASQLFTTFIKDNYAIDDTLPLWAEVERWLDLYFQGQDPAFTPPLYYHGTSFQNDVWATLLNLPYGTTKTYGELAAIVGSKRGKLKMSPQAIGNAVGANPLAIIIPCHRVVAAGGKLGGYTGGIKYKKQLLQIEGINDGNGR